MTSIRTKYRRPRVSMKVFPLFLWVLMLIPGEITGALTVIRTLVPVQENDGTSCLREAVIVPELYIEQVHGFFVLKRCVNGSEFSAAACGCVDPHHTTDVPATQGTTTPRLTTEIPIPTPPPDFGERGEFCGPSFRFIYNGTTLSDDRSVPSLASNSVRFVRRPGSVGDTSLLLGKGGFVTIWTMSYITFAKTFRFMFRFRLDEDFKYEDRRYTLFGDGPCGNYTSKYSVGVNPMKREVHADITLRNRGVVNLVLTGVSLDDWVTLELEAERGQIRLVIDDKEARGYMGASTIKSSPCPMEVGKESPSGAGYVGYIDMLAFHNCFGN